MKACRRVASLLMAYAAGEVNPSVVHWFEHHLHSCPLCAEEVDGYLEVIQLGRELTPASLPVDLAIRLQTLLDGDCPLPG